MCNRTILVKGVNDLLTACPEIAGIWDYDANELPPEAYSDRSNELVSFKCSKGHTYKTGIGREVQNGCKCLVCSNNILSIGVNTLADTNPGLAKEWSPNNDRGPDSVTMRYALPVKWICPDCKGEYVEEIRNRKVGDDSCPYCNKGRFLKGYNSFAILHQDLLREWDYTSNYLLCDPDDIPETYVKNVWWRCKDCGRLYELSPKMKVLFDKRHMKSCRFCKGNRRKMKHYL